MIGSKDSSGRSAEEIRADLVARLRARAFEIERAIFARIRDLSEPTGVEDPSYILGLRSAVGESLNYGLEGIERGREPAAPVPPEAARQARRAAREGVRLDTVMRRYAAGNKSLEEFIVAEADGIPSQVLCQILGDQGLQVDRLMESVAAEYRDELEQIKRSSVQKQADRLLRLLESSSLVGPDDLDYDFDAWHIGMIIIGPGGETAARSLAARLGCRLLSLVRDHETAWIWLRSPTEPNVADLVRFLEQDASKVTSAAIGEARRELSGWRQTFREAQTALQVMLYRPQPVTRCRDVVLVSAIMRDSHLATSLIETFLAPLNGRGDTGEILRRTLRAYFNADQNAATTAAALGVARHTVERHLRRVEDRLGQSIDTCNAQLRVALAAEELIGPRTS